MKIAAKIKPIIACDGDSDQASCDFSDICMDAGAMYKACNHMSHTRVCRHPEVIRILTENALLEAAKEDE